MKSIKTLAFFCLIATSILAQQTNNFNANTRFEQLGTDLPTPNTYRTASGAPGKDYWQQRADYDIRVELDDEKQKIIGTETITYTNAAPESLRYLWLQLDQNLFEKNSIGSLSQTGTIQAQTPTSTLVAMLKNKDYGYKITAVRDMKGVPLRYTINQTMMRVELPVLLQNNQKFSFQIDWNYLITEYYGRSGLEFFPKDGNYTYFIAHWFPRMCVYDDVTGWQNKQFLGQGEFALPFGDYKVAITVPNDHIVGATGELQNIPQVLSIVQIKRLKDAEIAKNPITIVSQEEAEKAENSKPAGKKTWVFSAQNVRDFAFTSSRKFIWDAMATDVAGKKVMCMSFFSKEANPLWGKYSTKAVEHTLKVYSKYSINYTYPVAISCHASSGGMEYPMISFNGYRPEPDGTYTEATKNGLISVIIHEVGHNFFPMIINSDERQWAWMDEGLNTFVQYLAEQEWDKNYPSRRGEPQRIVDYMKTDRSQQFPIMANTDNVTFYGSNAYGKPATALNILRETIMGRELFDYAFKEYARRWAFKHPSPADFFRTMEDASGVDLDWFWRGWFYGTEPVDLSLQNVEWFAVDSQDPATQKKALKTADDTKHRTLANMRNEKGIPESVVEKDSTMRDFYNDYNRYAVTDAETKKYEQYLANLSDDEKQLLEGKKNFYTLSVKNEGGLVMPIIVKMTFDDGTDEVLRFPAEIWRFNDKEIKKIIPTDKKVIQWTLDPYFETADIETSNNEFPRKATQPTRFQLFKQQTQKPKNPMQLQKEHSNSGAVQGGKN